MMGAERPNGAPDSVMVPSMAMQRPAEAAPSRTVPGPAPELAEREAADEEINGAELRFGVAVREPWDYVPTPPVVLDDDGYLIADAMPQNDRHLSRLLVYGPALKSRYEGRGGMVGADLSMPYVKGSPGKTLAPDLFVALAAEEREGRLSYKLWEEPVPDFVLEDLSPNKWRRDTVDKRKLYRRLGVREYWMFDETGRRLRDDRGSRLGELLVGYRLRKGEYRRIGANDAGRLPSKALGLELCVRNQLVRFYDPANGEYLPTFGEAQARAETAEQQAETAKQQVETAKHRAETAEQRAEIAEHRVEAAEQRAEAERSKTAAALARVAALEAELSAKHGAG